MERIFFVLTALCSLTGLALHLRASDAPARRAALLYYTNLSNLATAAGQLALLAASFWPDGALAGALFAPGVRLAMMLCIAVTGLVYWTVLAPGARARGEVFAAGRLASALLHGAAPALMAAEWALFADKAVRPADALWWLIVPAAYFVFICARARLCGPIPGRTTAYPYHFMNLERLGPRRFALSVGAMMAGFLLLGLLGVGLARWLN